MQNRRVFLTGAAASLALPLVGPDPMQAQTTQPQHTDGVLDEIARQVFEAARRVTRPGRPITGEVARQLGSALRLFGAQVAESKLDLSMQRTLRRVVDTVGRAAMVAKRPDWAEVVSRLRAHGLEVDESRFPPAFDDASVRGRALDFVLDNGVRSACIDAANAFDRLGTELDKFVGGRFVQTSDCSSLYYQLMMLEWMMVVSCLPFVEVPIACATASALYMTYSYLIWATGC